MSTIKKIFLLLLLCLGPLVQAQVCKIFIQDVNRFFSAGNKAEKLRVVHELKLRGVTLTEDEIYKMLDGTLSEKQWNETILIYANVSKADRKAGGVKLSKSEKARAEGHMKKRGLQKHEEVVDELNDTVDPDMALQPGYRPGDSQMMGEIREGFDRHETFRKDLDMGDKPQNFASAEVHIDFGGGNTYTDRIVAFSGTSKKTAERRVIRKKAQKAGQKGDRIKIETAVGDEHWLVIKSPADGHGLETSVAFGIDRAFDSEVKIFGHIVNECKKTNCDPSKVKGKIVLFSDYTLCPSCSVVVHQFEEQFPGITIVPFTGPNHGRGTHLAHGIEKGGTKGRKVATVDPAKTVVGKKKPGKSPDSVKDEVPVDVYGGSTPEAGPGNFALEKTVVGDAPTPVAKTVQGHQPRAVSSTTEIATPGAIKKGASAKPKRAPAARAPPKPRHQNVNVKRKKVGPDEYELNVPKYEATVSGRGRSIEIEFPELHFNARAPESSARDVLSKKLGVDPSELEYVGSGGMRKVYRHPAYPGKVFKVFDPLLSFGYPDIFAEIKSLVQKSGNKRYMEIITKMEKGTATIQDMRTLKSANAVDEGTFMAFEMGFRLKTGRATPEDLDIFNLRMETFAKNTQYDLGVEKFLREDLKVNVAAFDRSEMAQELWRDGVIIQDEVKGMENLKQMDPFDGPKVGTGAWYSMNQINAFDDQLGDIMRDRYALNRQARMRGKNGTIKHVDIKGFDKFGGGNFLEKDGELLIVDF